MAEIISNGWFLHEERYYVDALLELEKLSEDEFNHLTEELQEDFNYLQGQSLENLGANGPNENVQFAFDLASTTCYLKLRFPMLAADKLVALGDASASHFFYKKAKEKAIKSISLLQSQEPSDLDSIHRMHHVIETADSKPYSKFFSLLHLDNRVVPPRERFQEAVGDKEHVLRFWARCDDAFKIRIMKVNVAALKRFVEREYGEIECEYLDKVLKLVHKREKWTLWFCRTCDDKKFPAAEDCKAHIEEEHGAGVEPGFLPDKIGRDWAGKISVEPWEPVNAVAAIGMINIDANIIAYQDGWCRDWPLGDDGEERRKLLKDIRSRLVSLTERKVLSCSVLDWLMGFVVKPLQKLGLSKQTLVASRLLETPQSICFLDRAQLSQMLDSLTNITRERDYGTVLVRRAVDSLWQSSRVKEKFDFDDKGATLLLDKRLLQRGRVEEFDNEGKIRFFDPTAYYAQVRARGEDMFMWLNEQYAGDDDGFDFPKPIREHNHGIWVAVLRAVEFTCRSMRTKHAKKQKLMEDGAGEEEDEAKKLQFLHDVAALDTKILLTNTSRIELVNQLARLGFFDCRFYVEKPVKMYVMRELENVMEG